MAVLNARLGWTLGEPLHAVDAFLALGLRATGMASVVLIGGLASIASLRLGERLNFAGGVTVGS